MRDSLTQREYLGWQRYWQEEPWGPYRANIHAALIAREVRRPQLRKGSKCEIDDFMVVNPERRRRDASQNFVNYLRLIAKPVKRGN